MISLSVDKENGSPSGVHCEQKTSATASKPLLTFAAFRSRKEDDRSKYFKPPVAKRLKKEPERVEKEVKVQVGIVTMKDGLCTNITALTCFNNNLISSTLPSSYRLLYHDKSEVKTLPGSDEKFVLQRYKEEIDKSYERITFYLCSTDDYLDNLLYEDEDEKRLEDPEFVTEIQHIPSHDDENSPSSATEVQVTSSKPQEVESGNKRLISCPMCHSLFPLTDIEEHADQCAMWLLDDEEQPCEIQSYMYDGTSSDVEKTRTVQELTGHQHKAALQGQISELSGQLLSQDTKRLTVRRKFIWQDFKAAMETKIDPKSSLKVVFTGEPAVDDGGPKRELFSGRIHTSQHYG
ncbi:uncharacterized protein [Montipora foliosa]|uniref:uncharacterized protein n=1 Tax=Montipora foliosa TaxID=591990 RepID=UPI0035F1CF02